MNGVQAFDLAVGLLLAALGVGGLLISRHLITRGSPPAWLPFPMSVPGGPVWSGRAMAVGSIGLLSAALFVGAFGLRLPLGGNVYGALAILAVAGLAAEFLLLFIGRLLVGRSRGS